MSTKVALVTGASRGIGRAIAQRLASREFHVVLNYRANEEAANSLAQELREAGHACTPWQADVSERDAVKQMMSGIRRELGRLDVLVNNAGMLHEGLFFMTKPDTFWRVLEVNLGGVANCSRAAIPLLGRHKAGRIINIASIAAMHGSAGLSAYAASKGAVLSLSKVLARELGRMGVSVNVVAPGLVESDMTDALAKPEARAHSLELQPVPRIGQPDEVARVVEFLACDAPEYLTGEVIRVDGGSMIS